MPRKKIILIIAILIPIIIIISNKEDIKLARKVNYNGKNLKISIDGTPADTLPTKGNYYLTKYKCYSSNTKVSWDRENHKLNITNSNKSGGISCNLTFKSTPKLSDLKPGSYIKYTASGGKVGSNSITCKYNGKESNNNQKAETEAPNSCVGQNAREDLDKTKGSYGYCYNELYKFYTTGWRIAYIDKKDEDKAVITSAASPECVNQSNNNILDTKALKYCNPDYTEGDCICQDANNDGLCDAKSKDAWNMENNDYTNILATSTSTKSDLNNCYNKYSSPNCGYNNDLIDNGGYYWINEMNNNFYWNPNDRIISKEENKTYGLRPMIKLSSTVVVTDGSGTLENPYIISNNDFNINKNATYTTKKEVKLYLTGNNVKKMCISNSVECDEYIDFKKEVDWKLTSKDGTKNVYIYYKDSNDKIVSTMHKRIILDTVGPTNNSLDVEDKTTNKITLKINSKDAEKMCIETIDDINKCNWQDYSTTYQLTLDKKDGLKTVYAHFKDKAGNISSKSTTYNCTTCEKAYLVTYNFDGSISLADINNQKYLQLSSNNYGWQIDTNNKYLRSSNQNKDNTSSITTIKFTPTADCNLSFVYGVSSEANYDKLTININNGTTVTTLVNSISGTKEDSIKNYELKAGTNYALTLNYTKDNKSGFGKDIGYIKNIIIK